MVDPMQLVQRVRMRAEAEPAATAVSWNDGALDYGELVACADDLAARLSRHQPLAGDVIAISTDLSGLLVPALLACWSLGLTPWPFDPGQLEARLSLMFDQAQPKALVVPQGFDVDHAPGVPRESVDRRIQVGAPALAPVESTWAYLLFTSGSTGEPKGVMMPMTGLVPLLDWQADGQGAANVIGQYAARTFDVSFQEIGLGLWTGGRIVVFDAAERQDPVRLAARLDSTHVETLFLPTAALFGFCESLLDSPLLDLRKIVVAGEQLRIAAPIREFFTRHPQCELHNQYGPTETHVVTAHVLVGAPDAWPDLPPIGRPLPGVQLEILSSGGEAVAPGEVGELVVSGPRVASGYRVAGDVVTTGGFAQSDHSRRYATGDLVRQVGDELHYVGRADGQVKIRGHRVEVAATEAVLERHPRVRRCVVIASDHGSHHELTAYVVDDTPPPDGEAVRMAAPELQSWCEKQLPEPSVPTSWIRVGELPLTAHGKVDRAALPIPPRRRPETGSPFVKPHGRVEEIVAGVWARVLGYEQVGVLDEFDAIGGTSLQATRVLAGLRSDLSSSVQASDVFSAPTVRAFGQAFEREAVLDEIAHPPGDTTSGRIAIVGMACRVPGAEDLDQFWDNLMAGRETIWRGESTGVRPGFVQAAGRLSDSDAFDAAYFGMSSSEAARTDPQHRVLLELAVSALDDAGLVAPQLRRTGVFAGCGPSTYLINNLLPSVSPRPGRNLIDSVDELGLLIGNDKDYVATRISYLLDLHGPSFAVNAACATGLVAVDAARRALMSGSCDTALAGAVSIAAPETLGYDYEPGLMYSRDGVCRAFSADADGTVFSSGGGVVVLRRLEDALAAGQQIYAVIEGSAVGNDGHRKIGMTSPSALGQAEVVRRAWHEAGLKPRDLGLIEGHGTATPVGDAIEIEALTSALGTDMLPASCAVGSVKSNIGHLGWAAGIAGLIKVALAVSRAEVPRTLHCDVPAPGLVADGSPFYAASSARPWSTDGVRVGAVSSFGLGGANAHVVLSSNAPEPKMDAPRATPVVYPLSAKSPDSLGRLIGATADWLSKPGAPAHVCAVSAAVGREHHPWRRAVVGASREELASQLHRLSPPTAPVDTPTVAFLFSGQGFEQPGMGRELYRCSDAFRLTIDSLAGVFSEVVGDDLHELLGYRPGSGADDRLASIAVAQPAVYCFQLALTDLWDALGLRPAMVVGHSLGEFAAAATAGVFSREDGLRIVAERGRLLATLPGGVGMVALRASRQDVEQLIASERLPVEVAAINAPQSVAVAGRDGDLMRLQAAAEKAGIFATRLAISRAGHSSHMDPVVANFGAAFRGIPLSESCLPLMSNVTGQRSDGAVTSPDYWQRHLRHTVRFAECVESAAAAGANCFVEISAHPTLVPLVEATLDQSASLVVPTLTRKEQDASAVASAAASLYEAGADVDWHGFWWTTGSRTRVPTYRFDKARHWIGPKVDESKGDGSVAVPAAAPTTARTSATQWLPLAPVPGPGASNWLLLDAGDDPTALGDALRSRGHQVRTAAAADVADLPGLAEFDEVVVCAPARCLAADDLKAAVSAVLVLATGAAESRVTLVAPGAYAVPGHVAGADPWLAAALVGLTRVCVTEGVFRRTRILDAPGVTADALAGLLEEPSADEVAVRDGQALVPQQLTLELTSRPSVRAGANVFPGDVTTGVHVIVGGTRGIGLWTGERLVAAGATQLLVVGRSKPSPEASARLSALRDLGAQVDLLELDVHDPDAAAVLREAVGTTRLGGVVLAAGEIDDALVTTTEWSRFLSVLRTKVVGLDIVTDLLGGREDPAPYVLLYSSIAATLGTAGQASHAAANQVLNTAAAVLRLRGVNVTSVGWGPWADEGFLTGRADVLQQLVDAGLVAMTRHRAAPLLGPLMTASAPHVDVLEVDWERYGTALPGPLPGRLLGLRDRAREDRAVVSSATQSSGGPAVAGVTAKHVVQEALTSFLGRAPQFDRSLAEEGLDSLGVIRLRNSLNRELGLRVKTVELTSAGSIAGLVADLDRLRPEAVAVAAPESDQHSATETRALDSEPSWQQRRWRSLVVGSGYGHRVVPIFVPLSLDGPRLRAALLQIVGRHDALTMTYPRPGQVDRVRVEDAVPPLDVLVVEDVDGGAVVNQVSDAIRALRAAPQDVCVAVSWTVRALRTSDQQFVLLLSLQHLDFDGTSLTVFVEELVEAYRDGVPPTWPQAAAYADYAHWQREQYRARGSEARAFLDGLYGQVASPTVLPGRTVADLEHTGIARSKRFTPPAEQRLPVARLTEAARELGVPAFAVLATCFGRAVATAYGLGEVTVTSIFSGRTENRFEQLIGPLTSPWPLPIPLAQLSVADAARVVARTTAQLAEQAAFVPGEAALSPTTAFSRLPADTYFSDVAINFTSYQRQDDRAGDVQVVEVLGPVQHPLLHEADFAGLAFPSGLHLIVDTSGDQVIPSLWYHADRFDAGQAEHVLNLMMSQIEQPSKDDEQ